MTQCVVCPPGPEGETHEPDVERGWVCCFRAWARMAHALGPNGIPLLVDELAGLGYVARNGPGDPVAHLLPAGPVNGASNGPRVAGSGERSLPIRVDPTDLLLPARPASLAVAETGLYAVDQVGHLSVATELEFWARDWAGVRGERVPLPTVPVLARWLLDRLEWACATPELALDEFAGKLRQLLSGLTAATGRLDAPPVAMDRPCPSCSMLTLVLEPDTKYIVCSSCSTVLTEAEYRDHLEEVIKTKWTVVDPDDATTWPAPTSLVWVRCDDLGAVTAGYIVGRVWRSWGGSELGDVSHWAPIVWPADPGPAKDPANRS